MNKMINLISSFRSLSIHMLISVYFNASVHSKETNIFNFASHINFIWNRFSFKKAFGLKRQGRKKEKAYTLFGSFSLKMAFYFLFYFNDYVPHVSL